MEMFSPKSAREAHSKLSRASLINRLSESGKKAVLDSLTEEQAQQLRYDWGFWGRPNQQMPPGDWFTWLVMTGRGWGKTRTATENISRLVRGPTPLIAPPGAPLRRHAAFDVHTLTTLQFRPPV